MTQIGELRCSRYVDPVTRSDRLCIDHADPVALIHDETLREIFFWGHGIAPASGIGTILLGFAEIERPERGHGSSDGHISKGPEYTECKTLPGMVCFANNKLTIRGEDRALIYVIGEYLPETNQWVMTWPD